MESLLKNVLKKYLRYVLFGVGVWLMDRGIVDQAGWEELLSGLVLVISTLGYATYVAIRDRWFLNSAAASHPISLDRLAVQVKQGVIAPALSPTNEVPELKQLTLRLLQR